MNEIIIDFLDKKLKLRLPNLGGSMMFKELIGKNLSEIDDNDIKEVLTLFYCYLKASNKDIFNYKFDEFVDILDENYNIYTNIYTAITANATQDNEVKKKTK